MTADESGARLGPRETIRPFPKNEPSGRSTPNRSPVGRRAAVALSDQSDRKYRPDYQGSTVSMRSHIPALPPNKTPREYRRKQRGNPDAKVAASFQASVRPHRG